MIRRFMKTTFASKVILPALFLIVSLNASLWALGARPNPDPNAPPPPAWTQWVPMVMLLGVFYFFLLRPQAKQRRERDTMLKGLKKGDKIVTQSGFIVTVANVGPHYLDVKLNDDTRVRMTRSGVSEVLPASAEAELATLGSEK